MKKIILGTVAVVGAVAIGGKLYVDQQAKEIFDNNVQLIQEQYPSLQITAESVSYNPLSKVITANHISLTDTEQQGAAIIDRVAYTFEDEASPYLSDSLIEIDNLRIDVSDAALANATPSEAEITRHLAGDDNEINISLLAKTDIVEDKNSMVNTVTANIENLGQFDLSFDLNGLYETIKEAQEAGTMEELQANPMLALSGAAIEGLNLSVQSDNFKNLFNVAYAKQNGLEPEAAIEQVSQMLTMFESDENMQEIAKNLRVVEQAYKEDKEFKIDLNINNAINQLSVMGILMSGQQMTYPTLKEAFDIKLESQTL